MLISAFTKAFKAPFEQWAPALKALGFDGVELPVRPGYQVEPEHVEEQLPRAAETLAGFGLAVLSVAGPEDAATIAACGASGVPVLRTMASIDPKLDYLEAERRMIQHYRGLLPYLQEHGVCLGVQNHWNRFVSSAIGARRLVESFDPRHVGIVLDPAHCSVGGEIPELAFDIAASHLVLLNMKNFRWTETTAADAPYSKWSISCVEARRGLTDWPRVIEAARAHGYDGPICLSGEYDRGDADSTMELLGEDIAFLKELLC